MDAPEIPESRDRRLNRLVAMTVVILSVSMALTKIKDDNIVQAMQQDMSAQVDVWSEYQATRLKAHVLETAAAGYRLDDRPQGAAAAAAADARVGHYAAESAALRSKALAARADYDRLGYRDDQFDLSDGFASIALAVSAIAAVVESRRLLVLGWAAGAMSILFSVAGFAMLPLHPDAIIAFLT